MTRLFFLLSIIFLLFYTSDLYQKNDEKLFLKKEDLQKYSKLSAKIPSTESLMFLSSDPKIQQKIIELCDDECEILSKKNTPPHFRDLFNLDNSTFILISKDKDLLKKISQFLEQRKIKQMGGPYTNILLDNYSKKIKNILFPIVFLGIFIFILVLTRNILLSIDLFIPIVLSSLLTQGLIKLFFENSNLIIAITPLIIAVLNFSLLLHLFRTAIFEGSFKKALEVKYRPVLMAISTTFVGLLSLYSSEVLIIQTFGLFSSTTLVLTSIISSLYALTISTPGKYKELDKQVMTWQTRLVAPYSSKVKLFVIPLTFSALGIFFWKKIPLTTEATKYFLDRPEIRQDYLHLSNTILGIPTLEIILNLNLATIEELNNIRQIEERLKETTKKYKAKIISPNELVLRSNKEYSGTHTLPKSLISYLGLLSKSTKFSETLYNENQYKITLLSSPLDEHEYDQMIYEIKRALKEEGLEYQLSGIHFLLSNAQKEMIYTLIKSFLLSLIVICVFSSIWLRSIKFFGIFFYINIMPIFISLPILYLLGGSLNIASVMTYSISLGIIVDSSFHLINDLKNNYSAQRIVQQTKVPIIVSSGSLIILFSLFYFVPFLPIKEFGLNLAILLSLGLFFDLKILPALVKKY